jgi:multidrug efflux pump subunit AcrB
MWRALIESPVYAILKLSPQIKAEQLTAHQPTEDGRCAMKWDGEWHITYEVFRDLGLGFAAVPILIYGLVVGWFQSFSTPLVNMAAIPFSLVGISSAHGLLHTFFPATARSGALSPHGADRCRGSRWGIGHTGPIRFSKVWRSP